VAIWRVAELATLDFFLASVLYFLEGEKRSCFLILIIKDFFINLLSLPYCHNNALSAHSVVQIFSNKPINKNKNAIKNLKISSFNFLRQKKPITKKLWK